MNKPLVLICMEGGSRKGGSIPINRASMTERSAAADVAAGLKGQIHIDANEAGWVVTLGKSLLSIDGGGVPPAYPGRARASDLGDDDAGLRGPRRLQIANALRSRQPEGIVRAGPWGPLGRISLGGRSLAAVATRAMLSWRQRQGNMPA
jgi:hypothetical protein